MKKLFIFLMLGIFLLSFTSAFEFDNIKRYDENTKTFSLINSFGLGKELLTAKLDTPQVYQVRVGYSKVAEFTVTSYEDFGSIIEKIDLYDLNDDNEKVVRQVDVKYWGTEEIEVNDYSCSGIGLEKSCKIIGTHTEYKENWIDLDKGFTKDEIRRIGLFTQVNADETIEWIPTLAGKRVEEWAIFTSGATVTQDAEYSVVTYLNTGTFNTTTELTNVSFLLVGGGGSGGYDSIGAGGGGGAGGLIYNASATISTGNYQIVVGTGGLGGATTETNGGNSATFGQTAVGGGKGSHYDVGGSDGANGGSGGGAGQNGVTGGTATAGQGNNGGGGGGASADGGGGASAVGETQGSNTVGGDGGFGLYYSINGTNFTYSCGGGGAGNTGGARGVGGCASAGAGQSAATGAATATVPGTGSGGGGGGEGNANSAGASGVVVIRVLTADLITIVIHLVAPENDAQFTTNSVNFTANITDSGVNTVNVSLLVNGTYTLETNTSGFNGAYYFNRTLVDGNYNWTVYAYGDDGLIYNGNNGTLNFSVDLVEPTITLYTPLNDSVTTNEKLNFISNITHGNYTLVNATTNVWFINGTFFDSTTNTTIAGTSDVTLRGTINNIQFNNSYLWGVRLYYSNPLLGSIDLVDSNNFTFTRNAFSVIGENYSTSALETEQQTFFVNLTTIEDILSTTISLVYNGTSYFIETNCLNNECILNKTIDIPLVTSGDNQNKSFYWSLILFDGEDSFEHNTTTRQQNVSRIYLESAVASATNWTLNFTTWNEMNRTNLKPMSFAATFDFWLGSGTIKRNQSYSVSSASNVNLTLNPENRTFYTDAFIEYNAVGVHNNSYQTRNYNFQNATLTNTTQNIRLFLLSNAEATSFIQMVGDTSQIPQEGVLVFQQRYYPETGEYETVSITKTDNSGQTVGFYQVEVPEYRHLITRNGTLIKTTDRGKIFPEVAPLTLTFIIGEEFDNPWEVFEGITSLTSNLEFNETTGIVTYEWVDGTGGLSYANLTVERAYSNQSNVVLCNEFSQLTAGILSCNVSGIEGTFIAKGFIGRSPSVLDRLITFTVSVIEEALSTPFLLLWILFLITSVGIGLVFPPAGIILLIGNLILGMVLGITAVSGIFLWAIIAVAVWILIEVST